MTREISHFIGAQLVAGRSGRTTLIYSPATGEVAAQVALASTEETRTGVAATRAQTQRRPFAKNRNTSWSINLSKRNTSISLEAVFWEELKKIALNRHVRPSQLVAEIDAGRNNANLSSAIRVFVLMTIMHIHKVIKNDGSHSGSR
jgi:predicted DNA-binding ribbon-helix-helix protein